MIPRFRPTVSFWEALRFMAEVLFLDADRSEDVTTFEDAFARYHGAAGSVFVSSGRMALRLILKALDYPAGAGIVVPAFTHFSIPAMIRAMGFKPLFADIEPFTYAMTPTSLRVAITPEARAVIPTHLFGRTCPMRDLTDVAREHSLDVIEDCAQALGARTSDGPVGLLGRAAFFTFGVTKNFTTYSGGMVLSRDAALLDRIRRFAAGFGRPPLVRLLKEGVVAAAMNVAVWPPVFDLVLGPILRLSKQDRPDGIHNLFEEPMQMAPEGRMSTWEWRPRSAQARAGLRQLVRLDARNQARRSVGAVLLESLTRLGCSGLPAPADTNGDHLFMSFPIRRPDRFRFISALRRFGIDASPGYVSNCCRLPDVGGKGPDQCPAAESVAREIVHLPLYPGLGARHLQRIAWAVARADAEGGQGLARTT